MAEDLTLTLERDLPVLSRYRNTRLYEDRDLGETYFGVWRPPSIVERNPVSIHVVKPEERYRPDLIAYRVYGNPSLFWAIAIRNNILLPMRDMENGQSLICPNLDDVMEAIGASHTNNPGTV